RGSPARDVRGGRAKGGIATTRPREPSRAGASVTRKADTDDSAVTIAATAPRAPTARTPGTHTKLGASTRERIAHGLSAQRRRIDGMELPWHPREGHATSKLPRAEVPEDHLRGV